jgi:hypothetical protein
MILTKEKIILRFVIGLILVGVGLLAWPLSAVVRADLPPREPPTPVTPPTGDDGEDDSGPPPGATIELQAQPVRAGMWAVVQWQDSSGNWHDVAGWRGEIADSSRWWVEAKDFGKGPFRWVVKDGAEGAELGVSVPFHLPGRANETVRVAVSPAE